MVQKQPNEKPINFTSIKSTNNYQKIKLRLQISRSTQLQILIGNITCSDKFWEITQEAKILKKLYFFLFPPKKANKLKTGKVLIFNQLTSF